MKLSPAKKSEDALVNHAQELIAACPYQYVDALRGIFSYKIKNFIAGVQELQEESDTHGYAIPFSDGDILSWQVDVQHEMDAVYATVTISQYQLMHEVTAN
ncbi:hypothetical protein HOL63_00630 [Candidatus Peregrinibacteria bacterium]|jgi:hypothetical protein|nr:hypothetical protein [Candidatus Peregrinibacteria bacterium]MBT5468188.1 hypothetical protein [Candidatus Peregrinibacteria bacterium]MBT7337986.1 hypothetical protein [Candidatus Peregrinibacteria bacterium]